MAEFKKLFNEQCNAPVDCNVLEESVGSIKKQHMYISGPFLQAEDRNRNGRIYPQKIIEREVKLFNQLIESHEALGELDHPDYAEIKSKASAIRITQLEMDKNLALGKALVLDTRNGKELQALLEGGCKMGVSSRGTGNLLEGNIVADDYHMVTIDAVYMPSAQVAYCDAMYESVQRTTEWVLNESLGLYVEKETENNADQMVNDIQVTSPEKAEQIAKATEQFNKKIDRQGSKAIRDAFKEWFKTL
jgi:hypothetical protein